MSAHYTIIVGGRERWWNGATAAVRAQVIAEFATALETATLYQRLQIKLRIEREVQRRMIDAKKPSDEALF